MAIFDKTEPLLQQLLPHTPCALPEEQQQQQQPAQGT